MQTHSKLVLGGLSPELLHHFLISLFLIILVIHSIFDVELRDRFIDTTKLCMSLSTPSGSWILPTDSLCKVAKSTS